MILDSTRQEKATVVCATGEFAKLNRLRLREERFISSLDGLEYSCTIRSEFAAKFSGGSALGRTIRIGHAVHQVIGVLEHVSGTQRALTGDPDERR